MLRPKRGRLASATSGPATSVSSNSEAVQESSSQFRHLTMPQHNHNLLKFLNEDRTRQKFCDVSVSVGGTVYSAHKVVLAHGSSYFHAELSKNPSATAYVTLDHVKDSVFQHLLGFLYTAECTVAEKDLPAVAEAARFLDMMDILKLLCWDSGGVIYGKAETREPPEVELATEISLQRNLAETHSDVQQETLAEEVKTRSATTRTSARRRKC